MIYIIYNDSYFCGYNSDGTVWLSKDKKDVWYFKTLEMAKQEAITASLKLNKCTFKHQK